MELPASLASLPAQSGQQAEVAKLGQSEQNQTRVKIDPAGAEGEKSGTFGPSVVVNLSSQAVQALAKGEEADKAASEGNSAGAPLADAQGFGELVSRLSQTGPQQQSVQVDIENEEAAASESLEAEQAEQKDRLNGGLPDNPSVKISDNREEEGSANVVSAQVNNQANQGSAGANILAAARNQEQSEGQDLRDLFDQNDDQKTLS